MPCLCTTVVLALRLTSLTRMVIAFGPGSRSIVFWTLSKPVAVSCTRLVPGSSLSSESGVLPTNWRSMNTDAPGTSDSSVSDASVGAAARGRRGRGGSAFFGAAFFGARPRLAASDRLFLGTMRGAGAGALAFGGRLGIGPVAQHDAGRVPDRRPAPLPRESLDSSREGRRPIGSTARRQSRVGDTTLVGTLTA